MSFPTSLPSISPSASSQHDVPDFANTFSIVAYVASFIVFGGLISMAYQLCRTLRDHEQRPNTFLGQAAEVMGIRQYRPYLDLTNRIGEFELKLPETVSSLGECSICLSCFSAGDICRTMPEPCQHTFHKTCIDEWFLRSSRCPLCKRSIFLLVDARSTGDQAIDP